MENLTNHFFVLRKQAEELSDQLKNCTLTDCYSINRYELFLHFTGNEEELVLQVFLEGINPFCFLRKNFTKPGKGFKPLFREITGKKIHKAEAFNFDRSFALYLENGLALIFKMYPRHANLILCRQGQPVELFRESLQGDLQKALKDYHQPRELDKDAFMAENPSLKQLAKQFGFLTKSLQSILADAGYEEADAAGKWRILQSFFAQMQQPEFFVVEVGEAKGKEPGWILSVVPVEDAAFKSTSANEAIAFYARKYLPGKQFLQQQQNLLSSLTGRLTKLKKRVKSLEKSLQKLDSGASFREMADLLMAYGYMVGEKQEQVELPTFSGEGQVRIPLKSNLNVQQNAQRYYRKAKNQHLERQTLEANLQEAKEQVQHMEQEISAIEEAQGLKQLKRFAKEEKSAKAEEQRLPYNELVEGQHKILVGRTAKDNDELTFHIAGKDDLWLHARNVQGSHVIIKGPQPVPQPVIAKAAELAAWHSKARGSGMVPVMYTHRKFVRKPKGAPAGAVIVSKEEVVVAEPRNWLAKY